MPKLLRAIVLPLSQQQIVSRIWQAQENSFGFEGDWSL